MFPMLRKTGIVVDLLVSNAIRYSTAKESGFRLYSICKSAPFVTPQCIQYQQVRHIPGFFCRDSASKIWKSVSSVSNAGRRRGRGRMRGKKVIKDLNRGQVIGIGKENIRFPGLSAPIIQGRELIQRKHLPPDEKYEENLLQARKHTLASLIAKPKIAAIDRGWSGGRAGGRKTGPPDPVGEEKFEGFEGIILQQAFVNHMTGAYGRVRTCKVIVGVGNGNGSFGYAMASSRDPRPAVKRAKNRAAQRLIYVHRFEDRTITHNFFAQFSRTKVYAFRKRPQFGLVCHRLIKAVCELVGIKDIYVKVEGSINDQAILNAFLIGLLRQKSFQDLADETKLHIVEFDQRFDYFPKLLASPSTDAIESAEETPDLNMYVFDDNIYHNKTIYINPATNWPTWPTIVRKRENVRGHQETRWRLEAEYGDFRSFLTEQYNECFLQLPPGLHPSIVRKKMDIVRKITWKKNFAQLTS